MPSLGIALSRTDVDEYMRYLEAGGELVILPDVGSSSIYEKLRHGPVGVSVCTAPLYGHGRISEALPGREIPDDPNGTIGTHSVVVYGNTASGDFLLADPWRGLTQVPLGRSDLRYDRCRDRVRRPVHGILEAHLIRFRRCEPTCAWCTPVQTSVTVGMKLSSGSETAMSARAPGGEAEWRVAIGEEADVGLHPQRVAVGADQEAPDALGVLPGEQHGEEAGDDGRARRDGQAGQHEVLGNGQEPLVQRLPPLQVPG